MTQTPTVKMLIGPPNSGKSTYLKQVLPENCALMGVDMPTIVSSATARERYAQKHSIAYQETFNVLHTEEVEALFFTMLDQALARGGDIVISHRHDTARERAAILEHIRSVNPNYRIEGLQFSVDINEALRRNQKRANHLIAHGKGEQCLTEEAVRHAYATFQLPKESEGFDAIRTARQHLFPEDITNPKTTRKPITRS